MRQTTLDEPAGRDETLTALSRLGWDLVGRRQDGEATLYLLQRGPAVREVEADDLAAFLAAGAPDRDAADDLAVFAALRRHGPLTLAGLRRALDGEYDTSALPRTVRGLLAAGDVVRDGGGAYALPDVEL